MIAYKILKEKRLIRFTSSGKISAGDCIAAVRKLYSDPDYSPEFHILSDSRRLERIFTYEELETVLSGIENIHEKSRRKKVAVVVSEDVQFGLARMFEGISFGRIDVDHQVFRSMDEAEKWLASIP